MTRIILPVFTILVIVFVVGLLSADQEKCPMHDQHMKSVEPHHSDVNEKGDRIMGFAHGKTDHHFYLKSNGGIIRATVKDAADDESLRAIQTHMHEISSLFADGDFEKPLAIHGTMPAGAETMKDLHQRIAYKYEELENGAQVRIVTNDSKALDAVHSFLRFQIREHETGDSEQPVD